jgi:hypothetical protein
MSAAQEIRELRRQRDAEWATLAALVIQTRTDITQALDPKVHIRRHLWLAVGVALAGGLVLAPSLRRKHAARDKPRKWLLAILGMLRPVLQNIPVLGKFLPALEDRPERRPPAGGDGHSEAVSEDYGREEEQVRPFGVKANAAAEKVPVTSEQAAYRGYANGSISAGHAGNGRHDIGDAVKAALVTAIAETAAHIDWQKVADDLLGMIRSTLQGRKSEETDEPEKISGRLAEEGP